MTSKHKLLLEIPTAIESERLIIRKYEKDDGKELFALLERNDNRAFLKEHVDEATEIKTSEEAEIRIRSLAAFWVSRTRFVMGIWLKSEKKFIGNIWIEPKKWDVPSFELGYYLDQGYTKKGIASEAAKCSLDFIFKELNAHKVIIITRDTNERSYKLAERLGFLKEGHFRECGRDDEKFWGLLYYGMLRKEYEEKYGELK